MSKFNLTIGHLFPDLLNLYGDKGNIESLKKRANWRGIDVQVKEYDLSSEIYFDELDIVFIGAGSVREQLIVCEKLKQIETDLHTYVDNNGVLLAICSGYQLLGRYYKLQNETVTGLGILDIYTETGNSRLIGNVIIETNICGQKTKIVGFENHNGKTYINNHKPLGIVKYGNGNNGNDGLEGVMYKNVIGTYLHGPILPKNPLLADYLLETALRKAYPDTFIKLPELDDSLELKAREYIINRYITA
ncbi:MAG TPA: glutamine amidotransferase [Thermoanaerobacterales bacterium]|nr:glutamine amidotransferase [Thermoanaerobacterales bacterium]